MAPQSPWAVVRDIVRDGLTPARFVGRIEIVGNIVGNFPKYGQGAGNGLRPQLERFDKRQAESPGKAGHQQGWQAAGFLEDGDELTLSARCEAEGAVPISFGSYTGRVLPAR